MLFAVISEPRPEPPSQAAANRQRYWTWLEPLQAAGTVRAIYARGDGTDTPLGLPETLGHLIGHLDALTGRRD